MVAIRTAHGGACRRPRKNRRGQSVVSECGRVDRKNGSPVARSAGKVWSLEFRLSAIQPLVQERHVATYPRCNRRRSRSGGFVARLVRCPGASACGGRKRGARCEALGRSRGGWSTKIHAAVNGQGRPVRFALTGGQRHDMVEAETLLKGLSPKHVIGDKGYDSDPLRKMIRRQGAKPVIPARAGNRRRRYDREKYKLRNVVERYFSRVKHYRRVATRYEKTDPNYLGFLCVASILTTILNVNTT